MPVIKVQHVSSVSSEDPNHPADNLLNSETYRKWKCAAAGEKKAVIVLQLDKSTQIHSIDIGNEGSAFVEVLLGRSSSPDSFEVLLGMSTFMTPPESKQWSNTNRVRMFGKEKFAKAVNEQKWDRVKIVCTQPYNKTEKYGLSFIKLHSPPSPDSSTGNTSHTQPSKLGVFSLRDDPKDLPSGSLFFKKGSSSPPPVMSVAAQARAATSEALRGVQSDSPVRTAQTSSSQEKDKRSSLQGKKRLVDSSTESSASKKAKVSEASNSTTNMSLKDIMSGVVFSLSGFKNPFRGELRSKATDMGAKFQPDWSSACTHLVCAFPNTPKFNQVKAKNGLIVSKEWILDSYVKKRRLPAKKYRLSADNDSGSSEDDLYDAKEEAMFGKKRGGASADKISKTNKNSPDVGTDVVKTRDEEDNYGGSTDEESDTEVKNKPRPPLAAESSECDTEDEIERVRKIEHLQSKPTEEDPYGGSTDEDETTEPNGGPTLSSLSELPNFFSGCSFFLYGNFSSSDRRLIVRYITAYSGHIEAYMSDKVTHVITLANWDSHFDQALSENSKLAFVKPRWIFICHQKQTCVPHQPYIIVPT